MVSRFVLLVTLTVAGAVPLWTARAVLGLIVALLSRQRHRE
jgi:hypothetical protein